MKDLLKRTMSALGFADAGLAPQERLPWSGAMIGERVLPRLPPGLCLYAVGDVHGRLDCLDDVLSRIEADRASRRSTNDLTIFLGDLVDRGPASFQVVTRVMELATRSLTVCLAGNHERFLLEALAGGAEMRRWLTSGGGPTLRSYGLELDDQALLDMDPEALVDQFADVLPEAHLQFFWTLPLHAVFGNILFIHAGIRPGQPLSEQSADDQTLIRDAFFEASGSHPGLIVHGHTPQVEPEVVGNRVNIDTGAYMTGRLSCVALENGSIRFV
jgi:serine/threonine protein phosphatase 1